MARVRPSSCTYAVCADPSRLQLVAASFRLGLSRSVRRSELRRPIVSHPSRRLRHRSGAPDRSRCLPIQFARTSQPFISTWYVDALIPHASRTYPVASSAVDNLPVVRIALNDSQLDLVAYRPSCSTATIFVRISHGTFLAGVEVVLYDRFAARLVWTLWSPLW